MTNEEFQRLALEKLDKLDAGQSNLEAKLEAVIEQTVYLIEFRYKVKSELADIKNNISRIEIATADNWSDIARLKAVR